MRNGFIRIAGALLLFLHLALSPLSHGVWSELVLYNAVVICAIVATFFAPRITDPYARALIASALILSLIHI